MRGKKWEELPHQFFARARLIFHPLPTVWTPGTGYKQPENNYYYQASTEKTDRLFTSLTIGSNWFLLNNKIHHEWTRLKAIMLPSDETEIKVLFYFLITGIFIITLTKRTHKRSVNNDYFAASLSVSLTNPFDNFINPFERFSYPFENLIHPFGNFIHLLKWIANLLK